ncbi:vanadium-dependent haloperoxidase [Kitasatospora sp. NPDC051853]|uniref:vanadium-dependent haloperoxidase n=1 Tax=Kitasatospora sp. NPDC051853 TaxID=3364058 RepID=UPI003788DDEE
MGSTLATGLRRGTVLALAAVLSVTTLATGAATAAEDTTDSAVSQFALQESWAEFEDGGANLLLAWNEKTVQATIAQVGLNGAAGILPPVSARYHAIVSTCAYDAWAAYDARAIGTRLGGQLRQQWWKRTYANRKAAVAYASHRALKDLFPQQTASFDALLQQQGYDPANAEVNTSTAAGIAHTACDAVLNYRHNDGANQLGTPAYSDPGSGYAPVNPAQDLNAFDKSKVVAPDRWSPLIVNGVTQKFAGIQFAATKPYAMKTTSQFRPVVPPAYGTAEANASIEELRQISAGLTDRQKAIAEFWIEAAEGPTGHQNRQAQWVARRDFHTLSQDVKMFFGLNMAMGDSGNAAWESKKYYDYARPLTMMRYAYDGQQIQSFGGPGQGTVTMDGKNWKSYLPTPAFASYISGHSIWGATWGEYMKLWTGSDTYGESAVVKAGTLKYDTNAPATDITLKWDTFSQAADEDGMSRLYGGVHWRFDKEQGALLGRNVANNAYNVARQYFAGITPNVG